MERLAESELVLRLLRGEALDAVSRESQVPVHELESWKASSSSRRGLKTRSDPEERELTLARAKIGELMMHLELTLELGALPDPRQFALVTQLTGRDLNRGQGAVALQPVEAAGIEACQRRW
jgi:hypothetical protein